MESERMSLRKIGFGAFSAAVLTLVGVPCWAADIEAARNDSAHSTLERDTQNATTETRTSSSRSAETQKRALPVAPVVNRRESSGAQESTKDSGKTEGPDEGKATENSAAIAELESHRQKLMELRNLLKSELLSIQRDVTYQGSSRARHVPELDRLQEDLQLRSTDRETRVKRMREQVSRLEELLRDAPACQPELPNQEPVSAQTPPLDHIDQQPAPPTLGPEHQALPTPPQPSHRPDLPASDHGSVNSEHTTTTVAAPAESTNSNLPNALHERLKEDEHSTGPTDAAQSVKEMITATTITDHPIDRVGLANNLYGTGEIQLALEIYEKIPLAEQNATDRLWIQYQIANCYRRLGNKAEAARGFRIVTSQDSKSWIGKFAVWWLTSNSKIETAQERIDELNRMSQTLKEPVNANGNP